MWFLSSFLLDQLDVKHVGLISRVSPALQNTDGFTREKVSSVEVWNLRSKMSMDCLAWSGGPDKRRGVHGHSSTWHKVAGCGRNVG